MGTHLRSVVCATQQYGTHWRTATARSCSWHGTIKCAELRQVARVGRRFRTQQLHQRAVDQLLSFPVHLHCFSLPLSHPYLFFLRLTALLSKPVQYHGLTSPTQQQQQKKLTREKVWQKAFTPVPKSFERGWARDPAWFKNFKPLCEMWRDVPAIPRADRRPREEG